MMAIFSRKPGLPALIWAAAIVSSVLVLWKHAVPVLDGSVLHQHTDHIGLLVAHVLGGLAMLILGAAGLFIGWTRRAFRYHRIVGYGYLWLGSMGAATALGLSIEAPHEPRSTGTLALVWLAVAAMAFRAARHRRIDVHREWMIRSYVLSWTFVGCRLAESFPLFSSLGAEGITASIWLNWTIPLIVCEFTLQWRQTAAPP